MLNIQQYFDTFTVFNNWIPNLVDLYNLYSPVSHVWLTLKKQLYLNQVVLTYQLQLGPATLSLSDVDLK